MRHPLIDENAFGVLLAHYDLEHIEYSLEEPAFLEYLGRFSALVEDHLAKSALAASMRHIEFGHAQYFEFADGDQINSPLTWIREMRAALVDADLSNVCLLTAGGRWVTETSEPETAAPLHYGPSEPLRKALAAEAHAQPTKAGESDEIGWGPGLYVEKDAIEQLGKSLKNAPTALHVHSSVFYRIGG